MSNLGGPALCLNGHKIVVAHEKFVMKIVNKTSATVPQTLHVRGSHLTKKRQLNLNLRHSLFSSIGTRMIYLS